MLKEHYGRYICRKAESIERIGSSRWIFVSITAQKGRACVWTMIESGAQKRLFAVSKDGIVENMKGVCTPEFTPLSVATGPGLPSAKKSQEILKKMEAEEKWKEIVL